MKRAQSIASLGPIGYLPASGTWATLVTLPAVYFLGNYCSSIVYAQVVCFVAFIAWSAITTIIKNFTDPDPSHIVIDELVGCFSTFLFLPINSTTLIIGFLLFRFFDITKWCGVKYCEKLPGAFGILLDDFAAALLSNIVLRYMVYYGVV